MAQNLTIQVRDLAKQDRESFVEFVRLKGDFLFDEVYVKTIAMNGQGVDITFEYERAHNRIKDLTPVYMPAKDWAESRAMADIPGTPEDKRKALATTQMAQRLFAEGARQYNERQKNQHAEADFAADANFLASISPAKE